MGAPSPPPAPDYAAQQKVATEGAKETAKIQGEYNLKALQQSQAASMINQNTPIGTMDYTQSGVDAYGNPRYTLNAKFSPEEQALFQNTLGTQQVAGLQANNLLKSATPMYADAGTMMRNLFSGADSLTGQRMQAAMDFQQPYYSQDQERLDTNLRNQGIMPGTPAYKRQMEDLRNNQYSNDRMLISQMMPQSISEATQVYGMPLQYETALAQQGAPAMLNQMNTPQFTAAPPNYTQAYQTDISGQGQNYQNQIAGYNAQVQANSAMMGGIFGLGGSALKLFL